jgi:ABC-2 type transport system ATP-binding protein
MNPAIELTSLRKSYGRNVAIDDLSLSVRSGTLFGLLGPNGSGKSTTMGCLTGLLEPAAGEVRILGEEFRGSNMALKRRIGVMPETLGLFDSLNAQEFLVFQARMFGLGEETIRWRVESLLQALELADTGKKRLSSFSAGMRKRIAFAAAVIHGPELLFLDEPFESIDPAGVALMKEWLRRFTTQGRTVFLTTHVLDTAVRLCDEAAIIVRPGKLAWQGSLSQLAGERVLFHDGHWFHSLEQLFLHLSGQRHAQLEWL